MKEPRDFGMSAGDIGVVAIAAVFALCGLYLFFAPSPFSALMKAQSAKPSSGPVEVNLNIRETPKTQPE